jgi:HD-like signal output (HDOD) protein
MQLESVVSELVDIPPTPQIIPKLQALLRKDDCELEQIIDLLKVDVALSSKILRFANSTFYSGSTPASGLDEAIQRIGFREINRLVSISASKGVLAEALPAYNASEGEMLESSLACAQLMHALATISDAEKVDTYYTTGLMHGIGKIVINQYLKTRGLSLYGGQEGFEDEIEDVTPELERHVLGFTHVEAGAALLTNWKFPEDITEPIACQLDPSQAVHHPQLAWCLHLCALNAPHMCRQSQLSEATFIIPDQALEQMGMNREALFKQADKAFIEFNKIKAVALM